MNILQVIPTFELAGAETMCENLCYELKARGHKVCAVSLFNRETPITKRLRDNNIDLRFLDKKLGWDFSVIKKLRTIIRELEIDVVHTHLSILSYVMMAKMGTAVKSVVHTVHNQAQKENGFVARKLHSIFFKMFGVTPVALSDLIQQTIQDVYKLRKERIPVILNGVNLSKCIVKSNYDFCGDVINLIHIGRYSEQKNHPELIKAVAMLHPDFPALRLHLVGDGPLRDSIKSIIAEYNAQDYVIEHGLLSEPYGILNGSDIFVLPSKYEGIPMTIIEAMGSGLPIVASRVGGVPNMITDNESGLLCEPDAEDIAKSLRIVLSDCALREKLGKNALNNSVNFSSGKMAEEYIDLYKKSIEK